MSIIISEELFMIRRSTLLWSRPLSIQLINEIFKHHLIIWQQLLYFVLHTSPKNTQKMSFYQSKEVQKKQLKENIEVDRTIFYNPWIWFCRHSQVLHHLAFSSMYENEYKYIIISFLAIWFKQRNFQRDSELLPWWLCIAIARLCIVNKGSNV